mmetsp:Transcript_13495/g.25743  ORF Transcript_13495/g.25743 Transcript_13495/m.25743 type:complete len:216 (-) Transcript_13495:209-856(-)
MLKKRLRVRSLLRLFCQAEIHEGSQLFRIGPAYLSWRFFTDYESKTKDTLCFIQIKRELPSGQIGYRQAETPHVRFEAVVPAHNPFRAHILGRANVRVRHGSRFLKFFDYPKVSQLDTSSIIDQDVLGFDVSMYHLAGVQVRQTHQDLPRNGRENSLRERPVRIHDVLQRSTIHVLEGNCGFSLGVVPPMIRHDVRVRCSCELESLDFLEHLVPR